MFQVLFILICLSLCIGIFASFAYISYLFFNKSKFEYIDDLINSWVILKPLRVLINLIISEPCLPSSRKIQLNQYSIYLANVPHKLSKKRLILEMMCFIDLYYHQKKKQEWFKRTNQETEKYYTAISEQAYLQVQWLLRSPDLVEKTFCKEINKYLYNIRWTSNCLQVYNPNDEVIYFSSI